MKHKTNITAKCPIRTTLEMLGGKWRLLIISEIGKGSVRYGEVKKGIPEISEKMLAQELKNLVDSELITRHDDRATPPKIVYNLTDQGRKALALIDPIREFGLYYVEKQQQPNR